MNVKVIVLSRDPQAYLAARPHLQAAPDLDFVGGDVRTADPLDVTPDAVIHAATSA